MGLAETVIFYLVIGAAVAVAIYVSDDDVSPGERFFRTGAAIVFWPIFLPSLLMRAKPPERSQATHPREAQQDGLTRAISQVETELDAALKSLDGWAENVLAAEQGRLGELRAAWYLQADRIRELDQLLAQPEFIVDAPESSLDVATNDRRQSSLHARQANIERLRQVRGQLYDDLMGTLAWVRELVTMIHLAKFTGAPASRAEELIEQIAASVEGLTEVTAWHEEAAV